jgi:PPK2 family polyphosphate:nucleotide phosphotransferase
MNIDEFRVPPGQRVRLSEWQTGFTGDIRDKQHAKDVLLEDVSALAAAQARLWASAERAVLIIFQAMDAAGKDGTIKHVMSGVNPQGCEVHSFRAPNEDERLRHFLWRPARVLPARGRIAIFNRSYYEEVLVVRVHPQFLEAQLLPSELMERGAKELWKHRHDEINAFEAGLARNGLVIIKFFLHVSRDEQRKRFIERLTKREKHWKFRAADVVERSYWDEYMIAYEDMLGATSTEHAPWYVIPADHKWFTRAAVADVIASRIETLNLRFPEVDDAAKRELDAIRRRLESESD